MSEAIACLIRVGDNVKKNRLIKLDKDQVTIGRSGDVNYAILSNMISRCHAIIKRQEDGKWAITDNKSLNGVFVNGRQLVPFKSSVMEDGDMVQFGVSTSPGIPAEFLYKFHASLKVRIQKSNKRLKEDHPSSDDSNNQRTQPQNESDSDEDRKRKLPKADSWTGAKKTCVKAGTSLTGMNNVVSNLSKEAEYQAKLAEMERLLQEKELKQSEVEKQLEKERQERENRVKEVEELKMKEQAILMEMQDRQARLEKEKEELKQQMQAELESNLKEKERALMSQLEDQKQLLLGEKKRIEESLQAEMAKALEEKSKEVEERLISMKENLEKVIEKKDNEQLLLTTQLDQTREENECAKLQALKAREDVLSNFADLMEMELQCAICNELFIKATSLNCAHVFCKLCIHQWMKVKKECPNCRMKITSQMQAIALDSYIEKMVEQFTDDMKEKRKTLLEQRKADQDKFDGIVAGPSTAGATPVIPLMSVSVGGSNNARGRQRGRRGGRGRNARGRGRAGRITQARVAAAVSTTAAMVSLTSTTVAASSTTLLTSPAVSVAGVSTSTTSSTGNSSTIVISDLDDSEFNDDIDELEEEMIYGRRGYRRRWLESDSEMEVDEDNSDNDSSSSTEGNSREYYGGFGRCFKCGSRGHWANGCPF